MPETDTFRRHDGRWVTFAVVAAAVALVAHAWTLGFAGLYGLFGNGVDAIVYRHGGGTLLTGEGLYSFSLFETSLPFTYPPFAALVFVVLAVLPISATTAVVGVVNILLLYLAVLLSWRILGYRGVPTHVVALGSAVAFTWLEPVRMTLWLGQINLLLLILVLWDLGRPDGSRLRGIGVGLAAGLKLTPAFFVVYALAARQFRTAAVAVATFVATVLAGSILLFDDARIFWTSAIFQSDRIGWLPSPANQSVHGVLARIWSDGSPPMALWLGCVLVVGVLGLWCAVAAERRGARLLSLTICGLTTPMVSPFSWGHHWVWCVPLVVVVLDWAARSARSWSWAVPALVVAPFVAWYWTAPSGTAVIGTFMLGVPSWARIPVTSVYPIVFAVVLGVAVVSTAGPRYLRQRLRDRSPRVELSVEGQRGVSGAGRRKPTYGDIAYGRGDVANKTRLGLGSVEDDALDGRKFAEQGVEVVRHDSRIDDRGVEAPVPRA